MPTAQPFHILHVTASLKGGAAQHVLHLSKNLNKNGCITAIAAPDDNAPLRAIIESFGIKFYPVSLDAKLPLDAVISLRSILENNSWTHVHCHGHRAALIARIASRLLWSPMPMIYTVHGYHPAHYPDPVAKLWVNATERFLSRWTDAFICVSRSTQDELIEAIPEASAKTTVIENAIPFKRLSDVVRKHINLEIRDTYNIPHDVFVIGAVCRLQWQKSVSRLIRAFRILLDSYDDIYLLLVGDGPRRQLLETLVESLQISDRCIFTGNLPEATMLYPAMDLCVLPSLWEGLPLTVLEAWAAETPVIATNVPGSFDLIKHDYNGYLAKNNIIGIADEIKKSREAWDSIPGIIKNAWDTLEKYHDLAGMTALTEQVYCNTLKLLDK